MTEANGQPLMAQRFRSFLPVVMDIETGGFNAEGDAILEIAAVTLTMDSQGNLLPDATFAFHVEPFEGANIDQAALDFTGIDLANPLRKRVSLSESEALGEIFRPVRKAIKSNKCTRAILVGHNAAFDHGFLNAAIARCGIKRNPFHPFSSFDTATYRGWSMARRCLPEPVALRESSSTTPKRTRHAMIPSVPLNCFVPL